MDNKEINKKQIILVITVADIILFILFIVGITYIVQYFKDSQNNKQIYDEIIIDATNIENNETDQQVLNEHIEDNVESVQTVEISENMQKVITLKQENQDVIGWIQIDNTIINYPLLQSTDKDKDYYLTHNYKKEKTKYGSIYLNKVSDLSNTYSNSIIYGHNMKDEQMFNTLLKYENQDFYNEHKTIKIATEKEESEYLIVCAFKSRIFYQNEQDVFRYYNYTNFEDEKTYNEYINNCKQIQLYDTGVTATYGEQLITLITCEYSQENGRMVVVAKKVS